MEGKADFVRDVQAACKRHRSLGTMQSKIMKPRRTILPQRGTLKTSTSNSHATGDANKARDNDSKSTSSVVVKTQGDAITLTSTLGTVTETYDDEIFDSGEAQRDNGKPSTGLVNADAGCFSQLESHQVPVIDGQKKVQFSLGNDARIQDLDWDMHSQGEASTINNHISKQQNLRHLEPESSLMEKRMALLQDRLHKFGNFLSQPVTQSSVAGSSCISTLVNSTSAPMFNLTTYRDSNVNDQLLTEENKVQQVVLSSKYTNAIQGSTSIVDSQMEASEYRSCIEQQGGVPQGSEIPKDPLRDNTNRGKGSSGDVTDVQSQAPMTKTSTLDLKSDLTKVGKQEKGVSGKGTSLPRRKYNDPDVYFKVSGKLYQRLGKIGSGGSSEVHKVISSDCTIYALKKIRLKGRDYSMAYGFCQEILYLNKLKGKKNIIQLIDYEVTDKNLLQEVMNGIITKNDAKVKDDGYIYMVLEYGEIDLAHMLSQKWKEMDSCDRTIDENWLRFYWQQMLQAVNTIHEERIVHSDLKPANFLLVKGSLKLIDFGIAKAIMSDTTNIQRDSQVGTLSYMSPEAFMCNESDANGNIIKCGRPSDIWSLGCILYQMVYGRTPFSEYKTFWAKFKVITDPNHEIIYEPVSNPYLLELMKNCLAWDRNERGRIPELLKHPFLVPPPVPSKISSPSGQNCHLLQMITQTSVNDRNTSVLCSKLQQLLSDPVVPLGKSELLPSRELQLKLVSEMSELCLQLKQHLASS